MKGFKSRNIVWVSWALGVLSTSSWGANVIEVVAPDRKLILGLEQPDGSIHFFKRGLRELTEKIREVVVQRSVPGNFFQQMAEDAQLKGASFQLGRHLIPEEVVPGPLRDVGIDLTHFVMPDIHFSPEAFEASAQAAGEPAARDRVPTWMKQLSPLDLHSLAELYRQTYELPFFKVLRDAVRTDFDLALGASAFSWSFALLKVEMCLFTGKAVVSFWQGLLGQGIFQSKVLSSVAASLTYFLAFSFVSKMTDAAAAETARSPEDLQAIFERRALALYGTAGLGYLQESQAALRELEVSETFPALKRWVMRPEIRAFLLHPHHFYDLKKMLDHLNHVDREWLAALKAQRSDAVDRAMRRLAPPTGHAPFVKLRDVLESGLASELFCELLALASVADPDLFVFTDVKGVAITAHANRGEISLKEKDFFHPGRMSAILGHELWHRSKVSYRDAEIFRYFDKHDYARAFAAEEVLATLVEMAIMKELEARRTGFLNDVVDTLERINPTQYDLVVDLYGIETFQAQVAFLFKHLRSQHWDEWRGK